MKSCPTMVDVGRRKFLSGAGIAAAGAAAPTVVPPRAEAGPQLARLSYPSNRLANVRTSSPTRPSRWPTQTPCPGVIIKLGTKFRAESGPMATSSASPPCARTRVFRSATTPRTRRSIAQATIRASIARRAARKSGASDPEPSPVSAAGRRQRRHLRRRRRRTAFTAACRTCWRAEP